MKRTVSAIVIIVLASGCASPLQVQRAAVAAPASIEAKAVVVAGKSPTEIAEEENRTIEAKLSEVLTYCKPILSGFEKDAATRSKHAFWLSMSGLIAGSVLGPALTAKSAAGNAAWTSALSGWAGATNFAGQNLKTSGLSGTTIAETRNKIIHDLNEHIATATDGGNLFSVRRASLMKASAACTVYEIAVPNISDIN